MKDDLEKLICQSYEKKEQLSEDFGRNLLAQIEQKEEKNADRKKRYTRYIVAASVALCALAAVFMMSFHSFYNTRTPQKIKKEKCVGTTSASPKIVSESPQFTPEKTFESDENVMLEKSKDNSNQETNLYEDTSRARQKKKTVHNAKSISNKKNSQKDVPVKTGVPVETNLPVVTRLPVETEPPTVNKLPVETELPVQMESPKQQVMVHAMQYEPFVTPTAVPESTTYPQATDNPCVVPSTDYGEYSFAASFSGKVITSYNEMEKLVTQLGEEYKRTGKIWFLEVQNCFLQYTENYFERNEIAIGVIVDTRAHEYKLVSGYVNSDSVLKLTVERALKNVNQNADGNERICNIFLVEKLQNDHCGHMALEVVDKTSGFAQDK